MLSHCSRLFFHLKTTRNCNHRSNWVYKALVEKRRTLSNPKEQIYQKIRLSRSGIKFFPNRIHSKKKISQPIVNKRSKYVTHKTMMAMINEVLITVLTVFIS
ncbi:hypothetical protein BpHYR1_031176 [Brachionus plicatilis]|uniref:Uncharacterized protein n=1 Tax=Brachionus plicatilis TaxID=10195 RepID=A0A3M7PR19_BRAPC|nr:hypothetical protein BpHYR1_031176 [Brachionus plicatilis]